MTGLRATSVVSAGAWDAQKSIATVTLDYDARHRRRVRHRTDDGRDLLLDLPRAVLLDEGDGLVLENGAIVRVAAACEDLIEVTAGPGADLTRLAYHLGNRHLSVQLSAHRILIRADHVIAEMITGLGGRARPVREAFSPEPGAYGHGGPTPHAHDHPHESDV